MEENGCKGKKIDKRKKDKRRLERNSIFFKNNVVLRMVVFTMLMSSAVCFNICFTSHNVHWSVLRSSMALFRKCRIKTASAVYDRILCMLKD